MLEQKLSLIITLLFVVLVMAVVNADHAGTEAFTNHHIVVVVLVMAVVNADHAGTEAFTNHHVVIVLLVMAVVNADHAGTEAFTNHHVVVCCVGDGGGKCRPCWNRSFH